MAKPKAGESVVRTGTEKPVRWSEWAHPKHQGKYVTRGELIAALEIGLNSFRRRHLWTWQIRHWLTQHARQLWRETRALVVRREARQPQREDPR